jgi:hypothetical protein
MMAGPVQSKFTDVVSGYAVLPEHLAVVYYDYLPRIPGGQSNLSDTAVILGCVIAHELGHLLLGDHGHSIAGIMQARWGVEQTRLALMSRLSFLPEEARLIHAETGVREAKNNSTVGNHAHIAENETDKPAINVVTYFAPVGAALRDQPSPTTVRRSDPVRAKP